MPTNTAAVVPAARQDQRQVQNTLKKVVNWNDPNIAVGVPFDNALPQGAVITQVLCEVITAFNGASPTVVVGSVGAAYNNVVASGDVDETVLATTAVVRALGGLIARAADTVLYAKGTFSGASAGQLMITITYEGGWAS